MATSHNQIKDMIIHFQRLLRDNPCILAPHLTICLPIETAWSRMPFSSLPNHSEQSEWKAEEHCVLSYVLGTLTAAQTQRKCALTEACILKIRCHCETV